MVKSALIIVDMQNDFLTGSLALKECPAHENGEEIVEVINSLAKMEAWGCLWRILLDWHPADHISFVTNATKFKQHAESAVNTDVAQVYNRVVFDVDNGVRREQVLWPVHCIQGSWGAELHKDLNVVAGSFMIKKGISTSLDSYSAFFDNDGIHETELRKILQTKGIERVFVCGVATDVCVAYTVNDSRKLGFETYIIEDACKGVHHDEIIKSKSSMKLSGVNCITSQE
uniref:nicotinamidase n=1 Tax=Ciona savignyi TaxID=51511 RepID=H2ZGM6_CIOSA